MASTSRAVLAGTPCATCSRPLRPAGTRAGDFPGMFSHAGQGDCSACYTRKRNRKRVPSVAFVLGTPCTKCERPLRHPSMPAKDAPGTIPHRAEGMCSKCWRAHGNPKPKDPDRKAKDAAAKGERALAVFRRRCELPKRPEDLTQEELQLRIGIEEMVSERRRRGIPREGLLLAA